MIILLSIISILSISLAIFLGIRYYGIRSELRQLTQRITTPSHNLKQPLLLISSQPEIQQLAIALNQFIDTYRDQSKHFQQFEQQMKHTLTNLSHDLKTPLTVIAGYIDLLQTNTDATQSPQLADTLAKMERHTTKLTHLINDYFDLTKLQVGELRLQLQSIEINELIREEILQYYLPIQQAKIHLQLNLNPNPIYILGDPQALHRSIGNLISNSLKYGSEGKALIIHCHQSATHAYIDVTDYGKGILEENQSKIFERITTLEDASDKNYTGSGLGLAITKQLIEAMSGTIHVYSKPYERTTFTITMPLAAIADGQ